MHDSKHNLALSKLKKEKFSKIFILPITIIASFNNQMADLGGKVHYMTEVSFLLRCHIGRERAFQVTGDGMQL